MAHETGGDFATYAETRIFRPLGMTSTTYREPYPAAIAGANSLPAPIAPDLAARISEGYRYLDGAYEAQSFEYVTHMAAAGSMSSSANDMAKYMAALPNPEQTAATQVLRADQPSALSRRCTPISRAGASGVTAS